MGMQPFRCPWIESVIRSLKGFIALRIHAPRKPIEVAIDFVNNRPAYPTINTRLIEVMRGSPLCLRVEFGRGNRDKSL